VRATGAPGRPARGERPPLGAPLHGLGDHTAQAGHPGHGHGGHLGGRGTGRRNDAFAADFFDRYVRGREAPDYGMLLREAGIAWEPARPGAAWIGPLQLRADPDGMGVDGMPTIGSPLYEAGLDRDDRIPDLDGRSVTSAEEVAAVLAGHRPGDRIPVRFRSRGTEHEAELRLEEDPARRGVLLPAGERSAEQSGLLEAWGRAVP